MTQRDLKWLIRRIRRHGCSVAAEVPKCSSDSYLVHQQMVSTKYRNRVIHDIFGPWLQGSSQVDFRRAIELFSSTGQGLIGLITSSPSIDIWTMSFASRFIF